MASVTGGTVCILKRCCIRHLDQPRYYRRHVDHQFAVEVVVVASLLNPHNLNPSSAVFAFLADFGGELVEVVAAGGSRDGPVADDAMSEQGQMIFHTWIRPLEEG